MTVLWKKIFFSFTDWTICRPWAETHASWQPPKLQPKYSIHHQRIHTAHPVDNFILFKCRFWGECLYSFACFQTLRYYWLEYFKSMITLCEKVDSYFSFCPFHFSCLLSQRFILLWKIVPWKNGMFQISMITKVQIKREKKESDRTSE